MSQELTKLLKGESPALLPLTNIPKLDIRHDDFLPVTKRNVGYIVCGLAFDKDDNVLMMQVRMVVSVL